MDIDKLRAAFTKNRVALGALGALAVGAVAWRARATGADGGGSQAAAPAGRAPVAATPYYSAGGQTYGAGGYDSTASDVYNAIQPQLEQLGQLYGELKNKPPIPVPVPEAPAAPAPPPPPGSARRNAIAQWYDQILGRPAGLSEINSWDRQDKTLEQIRWGIVASPEAAATKAKPK